MFRSKKVAFAVWSIAAIFYAYQYILRVMPSSMLEDLMLQFNFDAATYGQFSGVYYIGYSAMHLPIGIALDRFGPRKVMTICILLTVIGLLPIIFSDYWVLPIIGRAFIGIGSSAAILGTFKVIRVAFNEKSFASMLGWAVTIGLLGAIYGGGPVNYLSEHIGYINVVEILTIAGLVLAILTYIVVPEVKTKNDSSVIADIKEVMTNKRVLAICALGGMMVGPLEGFADVWGSVFLKNAYGINETIAASLPSLIFIGMSIGSPLIGYVAEKSGYYIGTIAFCALTMAIGFIALVSSEMPESYISADFIIIGICCAYQILVIYKASTYVREHVASLTNAVANMIIMSFGYVVHTVMGSTIDLLGGKNDIKALTYGVATIPAAMLIALFGFWLMKFIDNRRRSKQHFEITPVSN